MSSAFALATLLILAGSVAGGDVAPTIGKPTVPLEAVRYRFVVHEESLTSRGPTLRELRGRVTLAGDRFRIDFDEGLGLMADGCRLLSADEDADRAALLALACPGEDDGGGVVTWIEPEVATPEQDMTADRDDRRRGLVDFRAVQPKVRITEAVDGEDVLGFPTRRTTIAISYVLEARLQGRSWGTRTSSETTYWTTAALGDVALPLLDGRSSLRTGFPEVDEPLAREASKLVGLPLRMKSRTESEDADGNVTTTERWMEVEDVERLRIAPGELAIPNGWRERGPIPLLSLLL